MMGFTATIRLAGDAAIIALSAAMVLLFAAGYRERAAALTDGQLVRSIGAAAAFAAAFAAVAVAAGLPWLSRLWFHLSIFATGCIALAAAAAGIDFYSIRNRSSANRPRHGAW